MKLSFKGFVQSLGLTVEHGADRIVPPSGQTVWLTAFTAGVMTFLAVFALALSIASGRLADRWADALTSNATIRISAPDDQMTAQTKAVLDLLATTPGVTAVRALTEAEQRSLLEPWFGPDLPVESLALPQLIEFSETGSGYDAQGLRLRLQAEAPGAVLDDHTRWRQPLTIGAERLRLIGLLALVLIGGATAAMITLAANAALSANAQVIRVLRLVGAQDGFIAGAFVRRFTFRAFLGALGGVALGCLGLLALPSAENAGQLMTGLGFEGWGWLYPLALPPLAALVAWGATRYAALNKLRELT